MALLVVQQLDNAEDLAPVAASAGGDTVAHMSGLILYVRNGSGAPVTVTITTPNSPFGLALADFTHSVPAGAVTLFDLSDQTKFRNPSTGLIAIGYSASASVEVAAVQFKGKRR